MRTVICCLVVAALAAVYIVVLLAVLHPRVTAAYRAYYIDRTSSDWNPERYQGTPEQGITFSHKGLPEWVADTHGFSTRDDSGRWTDATVGRIPGLTFSRGFDGTMCVKFTATPAQPLIGKTFAVKFGNETQALQVIPRGLAEYQLQFNDLRGANRLDFFFPLTLPRIADIDPHNDDTRRLGLDLFTLRILQGGCAEVGVGNDTSSEVTAAQ